MKITIPKPCHENWSDMTPEEKGKFCAVCSKTVHDFTGFSDEELVTRFNLEENICGRFREDQLGKNLNFSIAGTLALGILMAGSIVNTVHGQDTKSQMIKGEVAVSGVIGKPVVREKPVRMGAPLSQPTAKPLIVINGKASSFEKMKALNPKDIKSFSTLSGEAAVDRYGKKAKDGVVLITTKNK
ncbi:hypothetical protein JOE44_000245 [Chryseobacterium sp. PvR013]|uniref:hypothetical protein n=1 Tax=Chryseobacterium sp. PvR013 TaxID=2806595 RepID=UPI001AE4C6B9|nr:hypothetical protein [Chryseobacterium sp. PvR013]MBP1163361.1 hypothetical protein [Chryseobacterium sp. PvR013]